MLLNKGHIHVKMSDGADPEVFTEISDLIDVSWDGYQYDTEEITSHNSTDRAKEMVTTLYSSGKIQFTVLYNPANSQHAALFTLSESGETNNYELVIDGILDKSFAAYVETMPPQMAIGSVFKYKVTLLVNGAMTNES